MTLALQSRDLEILQFVFKYRVVTYDQLRRKFFPQRHKSVAHARIVKLCKIGFLKPLFVELKGNSVKCVTPTEKGWTKISDFWEMEMDRPHFKSESPRHDIRLVEILLRLEKLKVFDNFLSENMLQSSLSCAQDPIYRDLVNLQCDGALHLKDTEGQGYLYAFEFECSSKAIDRYTQKLAMYYSAGNIDGVIYICANQEILDLITRVDDEVRRNKETLVYRGLESSVLESKEKIFLRGTSGEGLGLF